MEKVCKKCGVLKNICEFAKNYEYKDGHTNKCKECVNSYQRKIWQNNKEEVANKRKERRLKKIDAYRNSEAIRRKSWRTKHKEEINKKYREYMRTYRANNVQLRITKTVSKAFKTGLKIKHSKNAIFSKLGYTLQDLMEHLQNQFSDGMNWENYGQWHIDHITPQSWLPYDSIDDENFHKCWCLQNLQPLWAKDNISKGNRYAGSPSNIISTFVPYD